ncbi:MAG: hypothetical protein FJ134_13530 [Deltaproteobacteria bacterium]|nr:hypothetical protein [Deltaproteobacteria bacterium]
MDERKTLRRFGIRVGYSTEEMESFPEGDPRLRQINRLAQAAPKYSIVAEVVQAKNCNSGYQIGDKIVLDVDGNFITKLCPPRLCVYAVAQFNVPVALINERLSEGLDPNQFHFMKFVQCPDLGVECAGYGRVRFEMKVVPRIKVTKE